MTWRSVLKRVFGAGEKPVIEFTDSVLGHLVWDEEVEGWRGTFNGFAFIVSYSYDSSTPPQAVLTYARNTLANESLLHDALVAAKAQAIKDYDATYHEEIARLGYEWIAFHEGKRGGYIFAGLEPVKDYRSWRIEFEGVTCLGIGFDD
jgi:hypothetical protein